MSEPLLSYRDVAFSYGDGPPVLEGVDFGLGAGERVALLGANGSGKTTLLHLGVGLLEPDRGIVEAFEEPRCTEEDFREVRARVGLLFQDPEDQLFCPTVLEDVAFGPLNLGSSPGEARRIARRTLGELGLDGFGERVTYRLSQGEKKLVSLATVLAMEPEVLMLDEPTAGLDRKFVDRIVGTLRDLEVPLITVSHDAGFLQKITSRAVMLQDGRVRPHELPREGSRPLQPDLSGEDEGNGSRPASR